jgi:hypothetical protein
MYGIGDGFEKLFFFYSIVAANVCGGGGAGAIAKVWAINHIFREKFFPHHRRYILEIPPPSVWGYQLVSFGGKK